MTPFLLAIVSALLTASMPAQAYASTPQMLVLAESRYFTVKAFEGMDVSSLLQKLNYDYFLQSDTFLADGLAVSPQDLLARNLDAIYREVQNVLGLDVPAFRGVIYICPDQKCVHEEFRKLYGMEFHERSFYVFDLNTVFISYEDLTLGMLGHEIAHAVISGYFVVPPPTKVQEVLAGYVEYSLRKASQ